MIGWMEKFRLWRRNEAEKLKGMTSREAALYIWGYYKLWIIGVLTLVISLTWGIHHYLTTDPDTWFFACFANTSANLGEGSQLWKDFGEYAGYDLKEKELMFHSDIYCDPKGKTAGNQYYQLLIAYLEGGAMDVLVMEEEDLCVIGAAGRLMDLEEGPLSEFPELYKDRLIYCEPLDEEYGKERVPVGIDLSGTILTGEGNPYPEGAALGINARAPHPEEIKKFMSFLLG